MSRKLTEDWVWDFLNITSIGDKSLVSWTQGQILLRYSGVKDIFPDIKNLAD